MACKFWTIERAAKNDSLGIHELLQLTYTKFSKVFRPTALSLSQEDIENDASKWVVVKDQSGELIGAVMVWVEHGYTTFCFLSINPEHRNSGIGTSVVNWVLDESTTNGVSRVRIVLRRELKKNIQYFTKIGFKYECDFGTGHHDFYALGYNGPI
jgi:N-acetylglutamate synthase-like GNAT family acetyltransferase